MDGASSDGAEVSREHHRPIGEWGLPGPARPLHAKGAAIRTSVSASTPFSVIHSSTLSAREQCGNLQEHAPRWGLSEAAGAAGVRTCAAPQLLWPAWNERGLRRTRLGLGAAYPSCSNVGAAVRARLIDRHNAPSGIVPSLDRRRSRATARVLSLAAALDRCSLSGGAMASSAEQQVPSHLKRVVIDNGGHMCKVGFAGQPHPLRCMLNGVIRSKGATGKVYVGDQYDKCPDYSSLQYRRSLERGCLVNWDTQAEVWSRALGADVLNVNPADSSLLLTEIPMCPTAIQDTLDEMVFEHFGFHSYCTRPAPVLAALSIEAEQAKASGGAAPSPAALIVDAGFSATHCVPIFGSVALNYGIKRLNVGGKMLTNHLKQIVRLAASYHPLA